MGTVSDAIQEMIDKENADKESMHPHNFLNLHKTILINFSPLQMPRKGPRERFVNWIYYAERLVLIEKDSYHATKDPEEQYYHYSCIDRDTDKHGNIHYNRSIWKWVRVAKDDWYLSRDYYCIPQVHYDDLNKIVFFAGLTTVNGK